MKTEPKTDAPACDNCGRRGPSLRLLPRNYDNPDSGNDIVCANCYWTMTTIPERIDHPWKTLKPYPAP